MPAWRSILYKQTAATYLTVAFLTTCSFCLGVPCQTGNWWDSTQDKCIECTKCEDQLIVLRPCQLHQDTICGTMDDLKIDWMLLTQTEPYWRKRHKDLEMMRAEIPWDWHSISLICALLVCLLFFIVAAYISLQHMRQWRQMEDRLNRDVEELSAKLMSRLAEVHNDKNHIKYSTEGNFYIEDAGSKG